MIGVELANIVAVQCPHDAYARHHGRAIEAMKTDAERVREILAAVKPLAAEITVEPVTMWEASYDSVKKRLLEPGSKSATNVER
jgi:hypothetical protein